MNVMSTAPRAASNRPLADFDSAPAATITSTAGHVSANLAKCGEMLDEIEQALFGPQPMLGKECGMPPQAACLQLFLDENAAQSGSIAVRLESIAARIGRRP